MAIKLVKKKSVAIKPKKTESLMAVTKKKMKKFTKEIQAEGKKRGVVLDVHVIIKEHDDTAPNGAPSSDNIKQEES